MKRGFSLVELMIAVGISVFIGAVAFQGFKSAVMTMHHLNMLQAQDLSLGQLTTRLREEALSSDAVWVTQAATGNELHFSYLDGSGSTQHWYYRFTDQLQRVDANTHVATSVNEAQGLKAFTLLSLPASALVDQRNTFSPMFANIPRATDAAYSVDNGGIAGNAISAVTIQNGNETRVIHLIAGASAESFGIEKGVFWHSLVWRQTSTHRFFLGLAQKTYYNIWAEVAYTTDQWATSHVWCAYDVFGPLDVSDPRAQPTYFDPSESAGAIFKACQQKTGQLAVPDSSPVSTAVTRTIQ